MKRRLSILVALVAVLSMVMAVPATAKQPLRGDMELYFNLGFGNQDTPCSDITWAGSVQLDGVAYGIAFFPIVSEDRGNSYHFEETWEVYAEPFDFTGGAVLTDCTPGAVVLRGPDKGVEVDNDYHIIGRVDYAAGALAAWEGRQMRVRGTVVFTELVDPAGEIVLVPATAHGTFRLN